ncbi:hypothetical protein [Yimella sp. cx-51]|uniref:hypothetical protein n=1 Tax=Yimella sp. cx-51 TaxID=2770551 RepID=UPI00165D58ED|nr:hypothetical protein [Yimella sp. cx-51]MBC9955497.1 hypothetical protein [Yimella sp. cx-51]QTH37917.1 hypothetical protein J5M86_13920 [Yimella sp. cx-51]
MSKPEPKVSAARNGASGRRTVSRANQIAAAKVFVTASKATGDPVPERIKALADSATKRSA